VATIRGRMVKVGGVAAQPQGAAGRTDTSSTGASSILRPAYSFNAGIFKPTMPASFTSVLDPNSILFWRLVLALAAVGFIWGWHAKLPIVGRVRL
jgi:hypothetical protein